MKMNDKSSEMFKRVIKQYLDQRAIEDVLFAETYTNPNKNLNDCITYIIGLVKDSGANCFTDDEIYSMAVHYYLNDIIVGKPLNCRIVTNGMLELTTEEKADARQKAIQMIQDEQYKAMKKKNMKVKKFNDNKQMSLF